MTDEYSDLEAKARAATPGPREQGIPGRLDDAKVEKMRMFANRLKSADPTSGNLEGVLAHAVLLLVADRATLLAELAHVRAMLGAKDLRSS